MTNNRLTPEEAAFEKASRDLAKAMLDQVKIENFRRRFLSAYKTLRQSERWAA